MSSLAPPLGAMFARPRPPQYKKRGAGSTSVRKLSKGGAADTGGEYATRRPGEEEGATCETRRRRRSAQLQAHLSVRQREYNVLLPGKDTHAVRIA